MGAQRRLSAIMFSDICGYSRIMGQSETRAMRILALHDEVMNEAIPRFDGNIIKRMGDGILAEFTSAVSAVECAMVIQRKFLENNTTLPDTDQFQVRIGVHLGDVVVSGSDILGDGVNVASRIEPLAPPGGICISQDVYNLIHSKVEMQAVSLGPHQLKNIERQVGIYNILLEAAQETGNIKTSGAATRPAGGRTTPSLKFRWLMAGTAAILVLLLTGVALKAHRQKQEARRTAAALQQADDFLAQNKPSEAMAVLQQVQQSMRPKNPAAAEVRSRLVKAQDLESVEKLRARVTSFMDEFAKKDWNGCASFADPESKMALGTPAISLRMAILGAFVNILQIKRESIRINALQLADDKNHADVTLEILANGQWKPIAPSPWCRVDNEWYMVAEKKPPQGKRK